MLYCVRNAGASRKIKGDRLYKEMKHALKMCAKAPPVNRSLSEIPSLYTFQSAVLMVVSRFGHFSLLQSAPIVAKTIIVVI